MANAAQLALLLSNPSVIGAVDPWNEWRRNHPLEPVDLSGAELVRANLTGALLYDANLHNANLLEANLIGANLEGADLSDANLKEAKLNEADVRGAALMKATLDDANLYDADFSGANLTEASLIKAELTYCNFSNAILRKANFDKAILEDTNFENAKLNGASFLLSNLFRTNFSGAVLTDACLDRSQMVGTIFKDTILQGCHVYGISVWDIQIDDKTAQTDLVITPYGDTTITVDNLKVAQFIYLLLNNTEISEAIETIGRKAVLILGRFSDERKPVLDAVRSELRNLDYMPILFDFTRPSNRSFIETVGVLAHMARFIIADVTDAKIVMQELQRIVPDLPSVPVKPILLRGSEPTLSLVDFMDYPWFLPLYQYADTASLMTALPAKIIAPAEKKAAQTEVKRRKQEQALRTLISKTRDSNSRAKTP